jgi:hypothetical protein
MTFGISPGTTLFRLALATMHRGQFEYNLAHGFSPPIQDAVDWLIFGIE